MKSPAFSGRLVRFGVYEVDVQTGELRKQGFKLRLQDKPLQILLRLLEQPGEVITREELRATLWPADTFGDLDNSLNAAMNKLREALGDSAETPRYIETLPRRGYRFIYGVNTVSQAVAELPGTIPTETRIAEPTAADHQTIASDQAKRRPRWFGWAAGLAAIAILAAALFGRGIFRRRGPIVNATELPHIGSLAVLPFDNLSGDPAQEYFSEGMTDALITDLAQMSSVKVISRTSSMRYKKADKPLPDIARELNADGIIEGTVQRSGDQVRITAQLIHAPADKHLWANSYERDVRDVFMLEREVAGDIADKVQARLKNEQEVHRTQLRTVSSAALEAYLQGIAHMNRFWRGAGDEELDLASQDFQRVIDAEPNFAPAYAALSAARENTMRSSNDDVEIARRAAERAVEIDPSLAAAWTALANVRSDFWNWKEAEQDYRRALSLNPNDADAHWRLGFLLDAFGRMDEGWSEAQLAQQLDPRQDHLEPALDNRREYDQIIQHETTMLQSDPDNALLHGGLYEGYVGKRMYKEAFDEFEQMVRLSGFAKEAARIRDAFAVSGSRGAWRQITEQFEHLQATNQIYMPINLASYYALAGNKDRAFYWLDQACKSPGHGAGVSVVFLNRDPNLEFLRSDPRYKDLLRRVGLPS
jgi:TolB-like protein/DNA-binding winged helix-turn-helix (wHTH) protein